MYRFADMRMRERRKNEVHRVNSHIRKLANQHLLNSCEFTENGHVNKPLLYVWLQISNFAA